MLELNEVLMTEFSKQICIACDPNADPASQSEINQFLESNNDWSLTVVDGAKKIGRSYIFKNFASALSFTNEIGEIAEVEGHHPLITTEWGKVKVEWWSHKIKNIHLNDLILAARCDRCYQAVQID